MKFITSIQSFTDVITNSSSSVFIMHEDDANYYKDVVPFDCFDIQEINIEWIKQNYWYWNLILRAINVDFNEISTLEQVTYGGHIYSSYWKTPEPKDWERWVDNNIDLLQEIIGKYYVNIEDHFEDAYDVIENAYGNAIVSESRH